MNLSEFLKNDLVARGVRPSPSSDETVDVLVKNYERLAAGELRIQAAWDASASLQPLTVTYATCAECDNPTCQLMLNGVTVRNNPRDLRNIINGWLERHGKLYADKPINPALLWLECGELLDQQRPGAKKLVLPFFLCVLATLPEADRATIRQLFPDLPEKAEPEGGPLSGLLDLLLDARNARQKKEQAAQPGG